MKCQKCQSERILSVSAKCSDCCDCAINGNEHDGYVPKDVLIGEGGYGDYVRFKVCLDCGQMQGKFPQPKMELEEGKTPEEEEE